MVGFVIGVFETVVSQQLGWQQGGQQQLVTHTGLQQTVLQQEGWQQGEQQELAMDSAVSGQFLATDEFSTIWRVLASWTFYMSDLQGLNQSAGFSLMLFTPFPYSVHVS